MIILHLIFSRTKKRMHRADDLVDRTAITSLGKIRTCAVTARARRWHQARDNFVRGITTISMLHLRRPRWWPTPLRSHRTFLLLQFRHRRSRHRRHRRRRRHHRRPRPTHSEHSIPAAGQPPRPPRRSNSRRRRAACRGGFPVTSLRSRPTLLSDSTPIQAAMCAWISSLRGK